MRRVALTGAGTVNPLAMDVEGTIRALLSGQSAITALTAEDIGAAAAPGAIGAPVRDFRPADHFTNRQLPLMDRISQFAVVAARQAVAHSSLTFDSELAARTGVIIGTAGGGHMTGDSVARTFYGAGQSRVHPFAVPRLMMNAPASLISMEFGLTGPTFAVSSACASSNHAIGLAFQMIRSGAQSAMLAGGADAMLSQAGLASWAGLRVLSPDGCRPFSADRNGLVIGEGAAVFVLEDYVHARLRGAPILAEIAGCAMGADAGDIVQPSPEGAARAMRAAMADAGLAARDVGYVNAHGTGTRANDRAESAAIRAVLPHGVAVSSTKGAHGHLMGASGAVELLACVAALRDGRLAPTTGWRLADPDCSLDLVTDEPRRAGVRACLSNAFAFGGLNAVLALSAP